MMQTPAEPLDHDADLAHGYLAVRCDADIKCLTRAMRILGVEPLAWRALEPRPAGVGSWLVEVAYVPLNATATREELSRSGVFRTPPR